MREVTIILERPDFWLGQVAAIGRLQRDGVLTDAQAMTQVNDTLMRMNSVDQRAFMERRRLAQIEAEAQAAAVPREHSRE